MVLQRLRKIHRPDSYELIKEETALDEVLTEDENTIQEINNSFKLLVSHANNILSYGQKLKSESVRR